MGKIYNKIKGQLEYDRKLHKTFGLGTAFIDFNLAIPLRRGRGKIGEFVFFHKHERVKKILRKQFSEIIEEYKNIEIVEPEINTNIVWVFWWQGIQKAPVIVKKSIEHLKKLHSEYQIMIVDKDNIRQYTQIPDIIFQRLENDEITITSFSDILRFDLLYNWGGIWCDATLYLTKEFPDLKKYTFFTVRHGLYSDYHVCKGLWASFFLAADKGNKFCEFVRKIFFEYYKQYDCTICYLLLDCIMAIGYEEIFSFTREVDDVPVNNSGVFQMQEHLNDVVDLKKYEEICHCAGIHKLRWKGKLIPDIKGKKTVYGRILDE